MKQTIQSANCALDRQLKHRNECLRNCISKQMEAGLSHLESVKVQNIYGGWFTSRGILVYTKITVSHPMPVEPGVIW